MATTTHTFVTDLSGLCRALEELGERVVTRNDITMVVKQIGDHESTIQLVWGAEQQRQGALFLVEVLPMLISPSQIDELVRWLAHANAQLACPAFQLRKQATGWKIAYSAAAFLDHEGRLSTRVVVEWLAEIRRAVEERVPELWALAVPTPPSASVSSASTPTSPFVEAVMRAAAKLEKIEPVPRSRLSPSEIAELAEVLRRDLPRFGDRALGAQISDAGTQYFDRVRILRLDSASPFPAQTAYAAWLSSGPVVLSHRPASLAAVNAEEVSARASDPDLAVGLASMAGVWTGASLMLEVRLRSVDDIPFRRACEEDRVSEAAIRERFAPHVVAPALERLSDGVRVTMWIVSESRLRRRVSEIRDGAIAVTEEVVADVLAFPGRMWGTKNNRLVPIG